MVRGDDGSLFHLYFGDNMTLYITHRIIQNYGVYFLCINYMLIKLEILKNECVFKML